MAMELDKLGIKCAAIYRPLNNFLVNPFMEYVRRKNVCKNQIKKGVAGIRDAVNYVNKNFSIALMIDQRVSEGERLEFFNKKALTTTIPGQFIKKFNCKVVPIYIERINVYQFRLEIFNPIEFSKNENIENITSHLNKVIEEMIKKNPEQWIWTHNRWK